VGDTSVPLPSHTNQQFGCFRLWGRIDDGLDDLAVYLLCAGED
jgi:hypothetical protein